MATSYIFLWSRGRHLDMEIWFPYMRANSLQHLKHYLEALYQVSPYLY